MLRIAPHFTLWPHASIAIARAKPVLMQLMQLPLPPLFQRPLGGLPRLDSMGGIPSHQCWHEPSRDG